MTPRRFPPPWSIEEANNACFIVRDSSEQALGYFNFATAAADAIKVCPRGIALPRSDMSAQPNAAPDHE